MLMVLTIVFFQITKMLMATFLGLLGKSDPYVIAIIDVAHVARTKIQKNNLDPHWNEGT